MKVTIQQIADLCNVSRGTVDRVLHNRTNVHPQIRQAVLGAIERTGYRAPSSHTVVSTPKRIGILLPGFPDKYFLAHAQRGLRNAQKKMDPSRCEIFVTQLGGRSADEHQQAIMHMLTRKPDGLVLNFPMAAPLPALVNGVIAQGVPVLTYFDEAPDCPESYFVGQDVTRSGRIAAGLMAKYLRADERVLTVSGDRNLHSHRGRAENFERYLFELTGVPDMVDTVYCHEFYDAAVADVERCLAEDERIRYLYLATQSVSGGIDGIRRAHLNHKITVICNDTTADAKRFLQCGDIDFVVGQRASHTVYQAIWTMYQLLCFDTPPRARQQYTDLTIYTKQMLGRSEDIK